MHLKRAIGENHNNNNNNEKEGKIQASNTSSIHPSIRPFIPPSLHRPVSTTVVVLSTIFPRRATTATAAQSAATATATPRWHVARRGHEPRAVADVRPEPHCLGPPEQLVSSVLLVRAANTRPGSRAGPGSRANYQGAFARAGPRSADGSSGRREPEPGEPEPGEPEPREPEPRESEPAGGHSRWFQHPQHRGRRGSAVTRDGRGRVQ
jgi:hypothetical protein